MSQKLVVAVSALSDALTGDKRETMTSFIIPEGVTVIKDAFDECEHLLCIMIPKSVKDIQTGTYGVTPFTFCPSLREIIVDERNPFYCSQEGILYFKDKTCLVCCPPKAVKGHFRVPDYVMGIYHGAFWGCSGLTGITFPNRMTDLGWSAFHGCSSLKEITLPNGIYRIPGTAFKDCSSLSRINIPDSVIVIQEEAFWGCVSLTEVNIPDALTEIGALAFSFCTSLKNIYIPKKVENIGYSWLANEQASVFSGCCQLSEIIVDEDNPFFYSQDGILYKKNEHELICCPPGFCRSSFITPEGVIRIMDFAFNGCTSLTSVTILDSVTSIGNGAFSDCTRLTSISIPNTVTVIGDEAFHGCDHLIAIVQIGSYAEVYCKQNNIKYTYGS